MASSPLEDEHAPLYTVGQVADMLAVKQAFLRRVDELRVVSPQRSAGGQRRYTRYEIRVIQQVVSMADEGITLQAIRRIIDLEQQLAEVSEVFLRRGYMLAEVPLVEVYAARERARRGDRDDAIPLMRAAVDHLFREGQLLGWGIPATGVLVETLLDRGADDDLAEAEAAIERLATAPADDGLVMRDIWLLRLRALLARAHGDAPAYAHFRDRYRDMAKTLGFDGHIAWAEAMP